MSDFVTADTALRIQDSTTQAAAAQSAVQPASHPTCQTGFRAPALNPRVELSRSQDKSQVSTSSFLSLSFFLLFFFFFLFRFILLLFLGFTLSLTLLVLESLANRSGRQDWCPSVVRKREKETRIHAVS